VTPPVCSPLARVTARNELPPRNEICRYCPRAWVAAALRGGRVDTCCGSHSTFVKAGARECPLVGRHEELVPNDRDRIHD
jgi:hypothetical protein